MKKTIKNKYFQFLFILLFFLGLHLLFFIKYKHLGNIYIGSPLPFLPISFVATSCLFLLLTTKKDHVYIIILFIILFIINIPITIYFLKNVDNTSFKIPDSYPGTELIPGVKQ